VSHLPPVTVPADAEFFCPLFTGDESVSVRPESYSSITGRLVHFIKTRPDCRLFISYLCGFNNAPLEGHLRRALHVLRYLASTPGVGPVFKADAVTLAVYSDAAYGVFRDGYSSSGWMFSVGSSNAPFYVVARAQTDVATCPMTAEYYAASDACKQLSYVRQLAEFLGWPPLCPVPFHLDNRTAIKLIGAPQVSVKSRHIQQHYHLIRDAFEKQLISVVHVPAAAMRADILTKVLPRAAYLRARSSLFNSMAVP